MARKIQLDIPEEDVATFAATSLTAPIGVRTEQPSKAPSLSGMARSLQAAAAASIREVDPVLIDDSDFRDRLDIDVAEIEDLAHSIKAQGQLIPILLRPAGDGRYRIVYGRRRLAALRRLGLPAKALIRDMDEDHAILAQGQENTFRKDLSWIEKAVFARQLLEAGRSDDLVCDALNIDQKARRSGDKLTGLSRMKQVTMRLPADVIEAVGSAPGIGRDRWYGLSQSAAEIGFPAGNREQILIDLGRARERGHSSDDRFGLLEKWIKQPRGGKTAAKLSPSSVEVLGKEHRLGTVKTTPRVATITVLAQDSPTLHQWICEHPDEAVKSLQQAQKQSDG